MEDLIKDAHNKAGAHRMLNSIILVIVIAISTWLVASKITHLQTKIDTLIEMNAK